jgi:hypothetical protein
MTVSLEATFPQGQGSFVIVLLVSEAWHRVGEFVNVFWKEGMME